MLLAFVLMLHGDSVKDRLPPRVEEIRQVAKFRLLAWGVKRGMKREEVHALIGSPATITCRRDGFSDDYDQPRVVVEYSWKSLLVSKVCQDPLYHVLFRLQK
jgi:hypothetical protein